MDQDTGTPLGGDGLENDMGGGYGRAKQFVGSQYDRMRERVEDVDVGAVVDHVRGYVRSNPGKAMLIAIGAGFLVGLMLRGSDEDDD